MQQFTQKKHLKSTAGTIQKLLFLTFALVILGRYLGSTGVSTTETFTLAIPEFGFLTIIYLLQAIPLLLLKITKLPVFKTLFLFSQVLGFLTDIPGLNYISGSEIYGGFIGELNRFAGYTAIWAMLLHFTLFFYVKNRSVDELVRAREATAN